MIGLAIGLVCGFAEFYLLTKLVAAFLKGSASALLYVLAKVGLLILALAAGVLLVRDQLVLLGVGVAGPLLIGSVVLYIRTAMKSPAVKRDDRANKSDPDRAD